MLGRRLSPGAADASGPTMAHTITTMHAKESEVLLMGKLRSAVNSVHRRIGSTNTDLSERYHLSLHPRSGIGRAASGTIPTAVDRRLLRGSEDSPNCCKSVVRSTESMFNPCGASHAGHPMRGIPCGASHAGHPMRGIPCRIFCRHGLKRIEHRLPWILQVLQQSVTSSTTWYRGSSTSLHRRPAFKPAVP